VIVEEREAAPVSVDPAQLEHERLYRAKAGAPSLVRVPAARFLAVDGRGSPGGDAFRDAVGALYSIAYTAKFALKTAGAPNVKVPPLEGLFSTGDADAVFDTAARERLRWTLMLRLPEPIDDTAVESARVEAARKRDLPALHEVRVERFDEGLSAQVLHVGPYAAENATVALLLEFIRAQGLEPRGRHHEIYLGDPRRAAPERLKTIIRQPVTDR
jgi:hypothetical protein